MTVTKRLIGSILAFAIILSVSATGALAFDGSRLRFTYYEGEPLTLSLDGSSLVMTGIPDSAKFDAGLLRISTKSGYTELEYEFTRPDFGGVSFSLEPLYIGTYYIELYFSYSYSEYYDSYIFGENLVLIWHGTSGSFAEPAVYSDNTRLRSGALSDSSALVFYLQPDSYIEVDHSEIADKARDITAGLKTDYEKALALHDWICQNIWYDMDLAKKLTNTNKTALETLTTRLAVCTGFSNLYAAFLRSLEIPVKLVYGYAINEPYGGWTKERLSDSNHVWNEVFIDGRWIVVDVTWDCGNTFENGAVTSRDGLLYRRYFDMTPEAFALDHRIVEVENELLPHMQKAFGVPSDWALEQVRQAEAAGIVPLALQLHYTSEISRLDFCTLVVRLYETLAGAEITGRKQFKDTRNVYAEKAAAVGIVNGVGDGYFSPWTSVTREEAAVMLARLGEALGIRFAENGGGFTDGGEISSWASSAVDKMQASGIMGGVAGGKFAPKSEITKQESIITMLRMNNMAG